MQTPLDAVSEFIQQILPSLRPEETLDSLHKLSAEHPQDPRPMLLLAGEYAHLGDFDQAESFYKATVDCAPDFSIARFQLGLLQLTGGRPAEALTSWATLELLPEGHYLLLFKRGLTELIRDQFESAIALLKEGILLNSENPPLNQDMEKVIQRILSLTAQESAPSPAQSDSDHFLLSAYRKPN